MRLSDWPTQSTAGRRTRAVSRHEQVLQRQIIDWCRYAVLWNGRPVTDWLHHIPAGGKRSAVEAAIFKGLGTKAGIPDLCLPIKAGEYGSLYIELKRPGSNKPPSDAQLEMHQRLREGGNRVEVARTLHDACRIVIEYLKAGSGRLEVRAEVPAP